MKYRELDLLQLIHIFRKKLLTILLSTLICGVAFFAVSNYVIPKKYTATASMYVYSNNNRDQSSQITFSDLSASQDLVNTYIVVLKSNTVLEEVIKELNLPMTPDDIRQILTAGAIDKTEAFEIGVTYENAEMAQRIVNAIIDTAPKEIVRVVQAGGVEVIDYAKIPDKPSSPNLVLNTVVGAVIGLVVSFGICVIFTFFDTKIRKEEDLTEIFTIPVLGSIPTLVEH